MSTAAYIGGFQVLSPVMLSPRMVNGESREDSLERRSRRLNQERIRIGALRIWRVEPVIEVVAGIGRGGHGDLLPVHEKLPLKADCGAALTLTEPLPEGVTEPA